MLVEEYSQITDMKMPNKSSKKTEIVSIRMNQSLKSKIQQKSDLQKISLNTSINQLLEKQVFWNELTSEVGWIPIPKATYKALLDTQSKDKIEKIATTIGKTDLQNSVNYLYGKIDLESILDLITKKFQSMGIQLRHLQVDQSEKIIIQHDLGKNWHYLIITELNELLNEINYRIIDVEFNLNCFSFRIISVDSY